MDEVQCINQCPECFNGYLRGRFIIRARMKGGVCWWSMDCERVELHMWSGMVTESLIKLNYVIILWKVRKFEFPYMWALVI